MPESFFEPRGEEYLSTELTRGPWSNDHQHGGPPAALMARTIEDAVRGEQLEVARFTAEFLKPVPLATLRIETTELRSGKKVRLLGTSLCADGVEVARATALLIRQKRVELPAPSPGPSPPRHPDGCEPFEFPFFRSRVGYHVGMEVRFARGDWGQGPTQAWMRMRHPLLADEAPSPLQRVVIAADSGNGVSPILDPKRYLFINPDLTVHLHRMPRGEWVCLDAQTHLGSEGRGLAESKLWDVDGPLGRSLQSLLVDER